MNLKSVLISSAAIGALAMTAPAYADSTYVSFFGGINSLDADDLNIGPFSYSTKAKLVLQGTYAGNTGSGTLKVGTFLGGYIGVQGTGYAQVTFTGGYYAVTYVNSFREDEFDSGFVVGAALGRDFEDGWRAELEIAWRSNEMGETHPVTGTHASLLQVNSTIKGTGSVNLYSTGGSKTFSGTYASTAPLSLTGSSSAITTAPFSATAQGDGDVNSFAIMANVWYDFDMGNGSPFKPFVGAGVGAVNLSVDYSGMAVLPTNSAGTLATYGTYQNTAAFATDTDEWTWGWQAAAGLAYEFSGGMRLSAQYRYFSTGDIDVLGQDFSVSSHEGLVGLHIPLGN